MNHVNARGQPPTFSEIKKKIICILDKYKKTKLHAYPYQKP
jgi:hypothetical protein